MARYDKVLVDEDGLLTVAHNERHQPKRRGGARYWRAHVLATDGSMVCGRSQRHGEGEWLEADPCTPEEWVELDQAARRSRTEEDGIVYCGICTQVIKAYHRRQEEEQ